VNRRRLVHTIILLVGLAGIAVAIVRTVDDASGEVMPSPLALAAAGALALVAIICSARGWVALFSDLAPSRSIRAVVRGTFYLSQLTKYVPAGGLVQAASQLGLAPSAGIPLKRAAVAYPVSAVAAVAAGATLASGLALDSDQPGWVRWIALLGIASTALLHRVPMAKALDLLRRINHRVPSADQLPTQRDIVMFYVWALATIATLCAAYATLVRSLTDDVAPLTVVVAFAAAWVIGFLAVPLPAGVGIREAVLVGLLPEASTASLLSASLALRLLTIATELLALAGNRLARRRLSRSAVPPPPAHELVQP
jgi:hypothetical protein